MHFEATSLEGVWLIRPHKLPDERGFFTRVWCRESFAARGMNPDLIQCNVSFNPVRGTLRGLHYQEPPHSEAKLVRCTRGAIFDVAVDLRRDSPTFLKWFAADLSAEEHTLLYLPEGMAHGYQTLSEDAEVFYQVTHSYVPAAGRGIRWNDPQIGIDWPEIGQRLMSDRDRDYPDLDPDNLPRDWHGLQQAKE